MKARVKATGEVIEVATYSAVFEMGGSRRFNFEEVELIEDELPIGPIDYWTRLEHQYAGMAMQGLMTILPNIGGMEGRTPKDEIVDIATETSHALVEKMRNTNE